MPPKAAANGNGSQASQASTGSSGRRVNFSGVPMGFENVPPGKYNAIFNGGEWRDGPKGEYFRAKFTITNDSEEWDGRSVTSNWSLAENSRPIVKQQLNVLGIPEADLEAEDFDMDEAIGMLQGAPCIIETMINKDGYTNIRSIEASESAVGV